MTDPVSWGTGFEAKALDDISASSLMDSPTLFRSKIDGRVVPAVAEALDEGLGGTVTEMVSSIADGAVDAELASKWIPQGVPSGTKLLRGAFDENGYVSLFSEDENFHVVAEHRPLLAEDIAGIVHVPLLDSEVDFELAFVDQAGYVWFGVLTDGSLYVPSGPTASVAAASRGGPTVTEQVGGDTFLMDASTGVRTKLVSVARTKLVSVGSSTFAGLPWSSWTGPNGLTLHQGANGGILGEQQFARFGSRPLVTSEVAAIPASGSVAVSSTNVPPNIWNAFSWSGVLAGVPGVMSKAQGTLTQWTFTRSASGVAVSAPAGSVFTPDFAQHADGIVVINPVKNNTTGLGAAETDVATLISWIDQAYHFAKASGKYVLFVNNFRDTNLSPSSAERTRLDRINAHLATYGRRCVDLASYVGSTRIYTDLGITPTAADLAQIALGNKGPSISSDDLHLSEAARVPALKLITDRLSELNWI
ncbi:hypothetical protein [Pseudoclavibacter sp. RFBB5]|uniref:hypothetical protein n=1 Tax=Pseudoclavibacter sp. RFBB5 TaxID=2080574 RepID=UPI000CE7A979|nr:hypothetical protein [Pseudoclavibacter sp. RFBB5]PPG29636.1 hypothetical protein C5B97_11735 [Pseudoclavibacter sp. RFBB5]